MQGGPPGREDGSPDADPFAGLGPAVVSGLRRAQEWGFFGDRPLDIQVWHARGFLEAAHAGGLDPRPESFLDLGAGGGLPGLVLCALWPDSRALLLDANERRCQALETVVEESGWASRVRVVHSRAELAGRDPGIRASQDLVVARSFGPPPVLAECAAPFLHVGGLLVVSEPPAAHNPSGSIGHAERWPTEPLAELGLVPTLFHRSGFGYQVLRLERTCPDRFPRREGVPSKRPLY